MEDWYSMEPKKKHGKKYWRKKAKKFKREMEFWRQRYLDNYSPYDAKPDKWSVSVDGDTYVVVSTNQRTGVVTVRETGKVVE